MTIGPEPFPLQSFGTSVPTTEIPDRLSKAGIELDDSRIQLISELASRYPFETLITAYPPDVVDTTDRKSGLTVYKYGTFPDGSSSADVGFDALGNNPAHTLSLVLESLQNYIALCEIGSIPAPDTLEAATHTVVARMAKSLGFDKTEDCGEGIYRISADYSRIRQKVFSPRTLRIQKRLAHAAILS